MRRRRDRLFLDTAYVLARYGRKDQHRSRAEAFAERVRGAQEDWTTEAVLIEIANGLSDCNRIAAVEFIRACYGELGNLRLVRLTSDLLLAALTLYESRRDKHWGLTDCISFVVMKECGLADALITDGHFKQAGFRALLID